MTDYIIDMTPLNSSGEPITSIGITYVNDNQGISGDVIDMQPYGLIVDYAIIDMIMPAVPEWHKAIGMVGQVFYRAVSDPMIPYPPGIMSSEDEYEAGYTITFDESWDEQWNDYSDSDVIYVSADGDWWAGFRPSKCRVYISFQEPGYIIVRDKDGNQIGLNDYSTSPPEVFRNGEWVYQFEIQLSGQTADIDRIEFRYILDGHEMGIYFFFRGVEFFGVRS